MLLRTTQEQVVRATTHSTTTLETMEIVVKIKITMKGIMIITTMVKMTKRIKDMTTSTTNNMIRTIMVDILKTHSRMGIMIMLV